MWYRHTTDRRYFGTGAEMLATLRHQIADQKYPGSEEYECMQKVIREIDGRWMKLGLKIIFQDTFTFDLQPDYIYAELIAKFCRSK